MDLLLKFFEKIWIRTASFLLLAASVAISVAISEFAARYALYEKYAPVNGKKSFR